MEERPLNGIVITPDTTFREHQQCQRAISMSRGIRGIYWALVAVVACALSASVAETWGSLASGAGAIALVAFAELVMLPRQIANARLAAYLKAIDSRAVYTFTSEFISWTARNSRGELAWESLDRVVETKDCYILVLSWNAYCCIPKRNIPPDRTDDFSALLRGLNVSVG
jgi:hypothetical protein